MKIEMIASGVNSHVLKLTTSAREMVLLKQYKSRPGDRRDRLGTEFAALGFLRKGGIDSVPIPIALIKNANVGIYSFIEGRALGRKKVTTDDLSQIMSFLRRLHGLRHRKDAYRFARASEACFSLDEYVASVVRRRARLTPVPGLREWLTREWDSAWKEAVLFVQNQVKRAGLFMGTPLPRAYQTLSASDFGFHNAIRQPSGRLVFVDFEYFGWDDPAKLIADFTLHPGMKLTSIQKRWFVANATAIYTEDPMLGKRLPMVSALLGMKWCLILLNCFLDESPKKLRERQLLKAKRLCDRMRSIYEHVP